MLVKCVEAGSGFLSSRGILLIHCASFEGCVCDEHEGDILRLQL